MNQEIPPEMPPVPPPPAPEPLPGPAPLEPAKRNTNVWLIVGIVVVVLCCCCAIIAAAVYAWNNGDRWLGNGALILNQLAAVLYSV